MKFISGLKGHALNWLDARRMILSHAHQSLCDAVSRDR
jgi:hypothetical protein